MRRRPWLIIVVVLQLALIGLLALVFNDRRLPLGVRGEWVWERIGSRPSALDVGLVSVVLIAYGGLAAWGWRSLSRGPSRLREGLWLGALLVASVAIQTGLLAGAPMGYGLSKWTFALYYPGSSGYYTVARDEIRDTRAFWQDYAHWARTQAVPRRGAHPPGLFLVTHSLVELMKSRPAAARAVLRLAPHSIQVGFRQIEVNENQPMPPGDRAALVLIGVATLLLCAGTVLPVYLLARTSLPACWSWAAAVLWPVVPSSILFQPTADAAFPLLAAGALASAAWSTRDRPLLAFGTGLILGCGMMFSLAFLAVGLTVAVVLASTPGATLRRRATLILTTGAGFLTVAMLAWTVSGANPFAVWWWNRQNHARFYHAYSRSYGRWVVLDLIELAVGLGLPATVWGLVGLQLRRTPRVVWASLGVLALLNFGGLTLSEVGRLWLPWMPGLLVVSAVGLDRLQAGWKTLFATVVAQGAQTLLLEAMIQVVYAT